MTELIVLLESMCSAVTLLKMVYEHAIQGFSFLTIGVNPT